MAGEVIRAFGAPKTLESSGGAIANNAVVAAATAYSTSADGGDFPHAEFTLAFTYGTAPVEGNSLVLMARQLTLDINSGSAQPPEATRGVVIGAFIVDNTTSIQYAGVFAYDLPRNASYYVHNNATGQTVSSGWQLKVTPMTYKPAP